LSTSPLAHTDYECDILAYVKHREAIALRRATSDNAWEKEKEALKKEEEDYLKNEKEALKKEEDDYLKDYPVDLLTNFVEGDMSYSAEEDEMIASFWAGPAVLPHNKEPIQKLSEPVSHSPIPCPPMAFLSGVLSNSL
jgi:hypothetical protein